MDHQAEEKGSFPEESSTGSDFRSAFHPSDSKEEKNALRAMPSDSSESVQPVQEQKMTGPQKFSHNFFDPQIAQLRKIYIKTIAFTTLLTCLVMFVTLTVYWGSLAHSKSYTDKLTTWVVDRDGSDIGASVIAATQANLRGPKGTFLGWKVVDPSQVGAEEDIINALLDEKIWAAIIVSANATSALQTARQVGDATYNASKVINVYYAQARNENAANSYITPIITGVLDRVGATFASQSAAKYLRASVGNETAITMLAQAPQTIASPVLYTMNNLRPWNAPVSTAVTLVGQIYITIFAFVITMTHGPMRAIISPFLTRRSYLTIRIVTPLLAYIPISLLYSVVSLPFKLPFGARYTYAGGFFLFFVYVYMAVSSLGLATEAMMTLLGPRFMAFFLIPLIIINISVASIPIPLEPWFYKYGYGFPVYNLGQAIRTIIFNSKSHLGLNAGVLLAWIAISCCTIPLFTILVQRHAIRAEQKKKSSQV